MGVFGVSSRGCVSSFFGFGFGVRDFIFFCFFNCIRFFGVLFGLRVRAGR